jgi:hypothetical protein
MKTYQRVATNRPRARCIVRSGGSQARSATTRTQPRSGGAFLFWGEQRNSPGRRSFFDGASPRSPPIAARSTPPHKQNGTQPRPHRRGSFLARRHCLIRRALHRNVPRTWFRSRRRRPHWRGFAFAAPARLPSGVGLEVCLPQDQSVSCKLSSALVAGLSFASSGLYVAFGSLLATGHKSPPRLPAACPDR